jgi:hypothetical protein
MRDEFHAAYRVVRLDPEPTTARHDALGKERFAQRCGLDWIALLRATACLRTRSTERASSVATLLADDARQRFLRRTAS